MTGIDWTEKTWNPIAGCTQVGPGCDNCYAMKAAWRMQGNSKMPLYHGTTEKIDGRPVWTGKINTDDRLLSRPDTWKKPTRIFVNSMSDIFHEDVPVEFIDKIYGVMERVDRHIYQVLTKRSAGMQKYVNNRYKDKEPPAHIWHGVSVESKKFYPRIKHLKKTKSAIRFLSLEPMLGAMPDLPLDDIHWAIVGGESGGPEKRQLKNEDQVRDIQKQCSDAKVAFFFKQWGGKTSKSGGKKLNGREWQEYPIDMSPYEKDVKVTPKRLEKLAARAKELIEQAESGRVDAYVEAGNELVAAKAAVRKAGRKWGEWLAEQGIPQRTATRAMRYAKDPDKYRRERVKDALTKREMRKQNGQTSGQKRALLKIIHNATDSEINAIYELMATSRTLKHLIPEEYQSKPAVSRVA